MRETNDSTTSLCAGGVDWHVSAPDCDRLRAWLADHYPAVLDSEEALLKDDVGSRVAVASGLVLKESTARRGRPVLRFGLRSSGSRRAFRLGTALLLNGVPTPRPVAWATVRRHGLRVVDYLIAEHVADARPLTQWLKETDREGDEARLVMQRLGGALGLFHCSGFSNRDMKDSNILVSQTASRPVLWVVDLDGVRRLRVISQRRAERDFWAIVRSLNYYGWTQPGVRSPLLQGYNEQAPARLRFERLPYA